MLLLAAWHLRVKHAGVIAPVLALLPTTGRMRSFDVPSTCGSEPVVPNTLLKAWISLDCPAVQDYVSLLVAVLQLRPAKVIYYLSNTIDETAKYRDCERGCRYFRWPTHGHPHQFATFPVAQCMRTLGAEFRLLDLANASSPFRRATDGFAGSGVFFRKTNRIAKSVELSMLTDLVRAYALHHAEGGLYLDGDVFVLNRSFARWRRCPVALSYNSFRLPDDATPADTAATTTATTTTTAAALAARANVTWASGGDLNTAAAFMARGTPFGAAWWAQVAQFDGTRYADAQQLCCGMPNRYERHHPSGVAAMLSARPMVYRLCLHGRAARCGRGEGATYAQWRAHVGGLVASAAAPTELLHLTNHKLRNSSRSGLYNQMQPVLREAVRLALEAAGGTAALRPGEADCARLALRMINFLWGNPNEQVDLDDVHGDRRRGGAAGGRPAAAESGGV